jgi:CRISPR-associated protein Cas2
MFIILAYDIPDDRRRTRLFNTLKRFGFAVQRSVFEFHLNHSELRHLKKAVRAVVDESVDQVRYYCLCPTCHQRTEMTYHSIRTANPFAIVK